MNDKVLLHETTPSSLGEMAVYIMHRNQHRKSNKMKKQRNMSQTKNFWRNFNEMEIISYLEKRLK